MNINPKISVIIPVYNIETYIGECVDSIIAQTYSNIEIILVNDGSTDNSLSILKSYASKDTRISIVDKKNGGLSSARNAGIKVLTGDYISFIDGDDWVSVNLFESVVECIQKYGMVDLITFSFYNYYGENDKTVSSFNLEGCYSGKKFYENSNFLVPAWSKVYKTSFLKENNFGFIDGILHEDVPFATVYTLKCNSVVNIIKPLYYYRQNRIGSILQTKNKKRLNDWAYVISFLINESEKLDYNLKKLNNTIFLMWLALAKNPQFGFSEVLFFYKKFQLIVKIRIILENSSINSSVRKQFGMYVPKLLLFIYYLKSKYLKNNWHIIKKIR